MQMRIKNNPFIFGEIVKNKNFINRKNERREISLEIENSTNIILYAPRRYGKTSLILQVFDDIGKKHKKFCGFFIDFYQVHSKENFLSMMVNEYVNKSGFGFEKAVKTLKNIISGISPVITFDDFGNPKIEIKLKPSESIRTADEIFQLPKRMADSGKLVSVFFDEFQEVKNIKDKNFQKELRSYIQHHNNVCYIFSGSKFHLFNNIFAHRESPLYNIGKTLKLDLIKEKEYSKSIYNRLQEVHDKISLKNMSLIYDFAGGVPYYVQMLSHEVYNLALLNKNHDIEELINQGVKNIIINKNYEFLIIYENLSPSAKKVLEILIKSGGKNIFRKEILAEYQIPLSTLQKGLKVLTEKAIVNREGMIYYFQDSFFELWLKDWI